MAFAGIIELSLHGRGPRRGFLFDPHRLALSCWATVEAKDALVVTFDRHFDLAVPAADVSPGLSAAQYDELARTTLDERNVDHLFAACEAGLVGDVLAIARSWPVGAAKQPTHRSKRGRTHQVAMAPTLERLMQQPAAMAQLEAASQVLLDVDLDCFVTPSDADPFTVIPWPVRLIREFLRPPGSERFWELVLSRCLALTIAREPNHCGGVVAGNRLFEDAAGIIFEELLETALP